MRSTLVQTRVECRSNLVGIDPAVFCWLIVFFSFIRVCFWSIFRRHRPICASCRWSTVFIFSSLGRANNKETVDAVPILSFYFNRWAQVAIISMKQTLRFDSFSAAGVNHHGKQTNGRRNPSPGKTKAGHYDNESFSIQDDCVFIITDCGVHHLSLSLSLSLSLLLFLSISCYPFFHSPVDSICCRALRRKQT